MMKPLMAILILALFAAGWQPAHGDDDDWRKDWNKRQREWQKEREKAAREWEKDRREAAREWEKQQRELAREWEHRGRNRDRWGYWDDGRYFQPYYDRGFVRPAPPVYRHETYYWPAQPDVAPYPDDRGLYDHGGYGFYGHGYHDDAYYGDSGAYYGPVAPLYPDYGWRSNRGSQIGGSIGSQIGAALGGPEGAAIGGSIGAAIGDRVDRD